MIYVVEHKVKGHTFDVDVPQKFSVCVWGLMFSIEIKAGFSHEGKQHFVVIFKGKKHFWSASTLVSYYRMALPTEQVPTTPSRAYQREDIFGDDPRNDY